MTKYTIEDVKHIVPVEQTQAVIEAVEKYLNTGEIPPYDPCVSCEPAHARKLVSLIQVAERNGLWPPKRTETKPKPKEDSKAEVSNLITDVDTANAVGKAAAKVINEG